MTPEGEWAEFLAARAYCCYFSERLEDAAAALKWSVRLAPHDSIRKEKLDRLMAYLQEAQSAGSYYVYRPPERILPEPAEPVGPRWVGTNDGNRVLVQILKPDHLMPMTAAGMSSAMNVGFSLQRHSVELPNGQRAWAEIPTHVSGRTMAAYWIELSPNEFALVHKPLRGAHVPPDPRHVGQPVLPERQSRTAWGAPVPMTSERLLPWEETVLRQAAESVKLESTCTSPNRRLLPGATGPAIGFVPTHRHLPPIPGHRTPLLQFQT